MADAETIFRDESLQRLFATRGFVTIRLLDPAEVPTARARLAAVYESRCAGGARERAAYQASLWHADPAYRRRALELARTVLADRLVALAPNYRFLLGGILVKPPGADALIPHREWTLTADPRQTSLNCWCPLVDVDERNGALELLPGSHRILPGNVEGPGIPPFYGAYGEGLKRLSHTIRLRAGEAALFDHRLLHWSRPNRSAEPRIAIGGGFVPEAARPVLHRREGDGGPRNVRTIEPAAGAWADIMVGLDAPESSGLRSGGAIRHRNRSMGPAEFEARLKALDAAR